MNASYRLARRIVIFVIGLTVLLLGVAMLVRPGPGMVTVLLGLAILAIEFAWARYWLNKIRSTAGSAQRNLAGWAGRWRWLGMGKRDKATQSVANYPELDRDP